MIRKKTNEPHFKTSFKCRKVKHFDYTFYRDRLEEINWRPLYDCTNPNEAWDIFYRNVLEILDKYYPIIEYNNIKVKAAWINNELFELIKEKEEAFKIA